MHTNDSEVSQKRYKYNGKERDTETGLDYYGARYYASWLCRFISVDPQKDNYPFQNSYAYADNNPITLMDFNGEGTGGDEDDPGVYDINMFDQTEIGKYERSEKSSTVGKEGSQFNVVGLNDSEGNLIGWLAQRVVPESEYSLIGGQGEGLQDAFIISLDSMANFIKNSSDYYDQAKSSFFYDITMREIDESPAKSFIMGGGLSAGVGVSGTFQSLSRIPAKLKSMGVGVKGLLNSAGKISNLKKFLSLRNTVKNVVDPKDMHFMQSSIKNTTGEYTVLENAKALKSGSLDPEVLKMDAWKDATGKIWTLDHRRLAAFKLSELPEAPVNWVTPNQVENQMWKMTTKTGGKSIRLKLGGGKNITVQ